MLDDIKRLEEILEPRHAPALRILRAALEKAAERIPQVAVGEQSSDMADRRSSASRSGTAWVPSSGNIG